MLGRQPPELQRFLLESSVLDRFTPEVLAAVTGRPDAGDVARGLVERHLFTVRLEDAARERYRYHHLFQAFLRARLEEEDAAALPELHRRAAAAWIAEGEHADAVPHLLAAGDHAAAADALEPIAESLVTTPQAQTLAAWLDALPADSWADRPRLITAHAALLLTRGEHEASFGEFERAIERLLEAGDHEGAAAALLRLLQSMITAGARPTRRIEAGVRYTSRIRPDARALPAATILLASSHAYAGDFARAAQQLDAALALPAAAGQPALGIYAAVVRAYYIDFHVAQPEEAVLALDGAIADLERHEEHDDLAFMPYARMFRVYLLNDLGRYDEAFPEIVRTADAAARRGMARTHRRVISWIRSVALAGSGRWDDLERELAPPERAPGQREPTSYSYRHRTLAAQLAAARGEPAAVRAHATAARDAMAAFGRGFDNPMLLCDAAGAAAAVGEQALAAELAAAAAAIAGELGGPWARARALPARRGCAGRRPRRRGAGRGPAAHRAVVAGRALDPARTRPRGRPAGASDGARPRPSRARGPAGRGLWRRGLPRVRRLDRGGARARPRPAGRGRGRGCQRRGRRRRAPAARPRCLGPRGGPARPRPSRRPPAACHPADHARPARRRARRGARP